MDRHVRVRLRDAITIRKLITMWYFEFAKDYVFRGESHPFWEIVYVDKGEVEVQADDRSVRLASGGMIFHKPGEFHRFHASGGTAPNIVVLTFECASPAMRSFDNAVLSLGDEERNLLSDIVKEGARVFEYPFTHPLVRRRQAGAIDEQLLRVQLELLLLKLLRRLKAPAKAEGLRTLAGEKLERETAEDVVRFLRAQLAGTLTLDEISRALHLSKTRLKETFKRYTGESVIRYYQKLKIEQAKISIREETATLTEIAERLGFSGVHSFSRAFKKTVGMSPTEYARSVKARL